MSTAVQAPSPTAGMDLGQRIKHVGGRTNAAGYVEFGSVQALEALVNQVLRDLPAPSIPPLNDALAEILGRMCFQCIRIAQLFRIAGQTIPNKAEAEQAAVIHFLLGHYLADPEGYPANADAAMKAMHEKFMASRGQEAKGE